MILVDTNTWVAHLRSADARLVSFLEENRVATCDVVIGELELGAGIPKTVATLLGRLPHVPCPTADRTLLFVRRHRSAFSGSGVGWADAQIIVAALEFGAMLHSSDRPMRTVWRRLGYRFP